MVAFPFINKTSGIWHLFWHCSFCHPSIPQPSLVLATLVRCSQACGAVLQCLGSRVKHTVANRVDFQRFLQTWRWKPHKPRKSQGFPSCKGWPHMIIQKPSQTARIKTTQETVLYPDICQGTCLTIIQSFRSCKLRPLLDRWCWNAKCVSYIRSQTQSNGHVTNVVKVTIPGLCWPLCSFPAKGRPGFHNNMALFSRNIKNTAIRAHLRKLCTVSCDTSMADMFTSNSQIHVVFGSMCKYQDSTRYAATHWHLTKQGSQLVAAPRR